MTDLKNNRSLTILIVAGFFGICAIICTILVTSTIRSFGQTLSNDTVAVKGYAEKLVDSDLAEWDISLKVTADNRSGTVALADSREAILANWLAESGIKAEQVRYTPISLRSVLKTDKDGNETNLVDYFIGNVDITVSSSDTALVEKLSREIIKLNDDVMSISSEAPRFLIRDLEQYKLELIKEATQTATSRANEIVSAAKMRLGILKSANQGVFQVTALNSVDVSGYGEYDTSSRQKKVSLVATLEFGIDQ